MACNLNRLSLKQNSTPSIHIHSFIHSGHFYSAPSSPTPLLLRGAPDYSTDTVSRRSAQATAGTGLAQGPYVAA